MPGQNEVSTDRAVGDDLDSFSIEKARLVVMWLPMLITTLSLIAYGWVLDFHQVSCYFTSSMVYKNHANKHIAISLCLQFTIGLCL